MILSQKFAVSLGSEFVCIASENKRKIVEFPAYIAVSKDGNEVLAIGEEARRMVGKEPINILAFNILQEGIPGDEELFQKFLRYCLTKMSAGKMTVFPPTIVVTGFLQHEGARTAIKEGVIKAGSKEVRLLEAGVAAAIGLDLPIDTPDFQCTLILENDWAIYTVISLSGVVIQKKLRIGLKDLIEDLCVYLVDSHHFSPSKEDLRDRILTSGFSSIPGLIGWERWMSEIQSGKIGSKDLDQEAITKGISPAFLRAVFQINESHKELEQEKGLKVSAAPIYLTGEFSRIPGLDKLLCQHLGRRIIRKENGRTAMVQGTLVVLENLVWLKKARK